MQLICYHKKNRATFPNFQIILKLKRLILNIGGSSILNLKISICHNYITSENQVNKETNICPIVAKLVSASARCWGGNGFESRPVLRYSLRPQKLKWLCLVGIP